MARVCPCPLHCSVFCGRRGREFLVPQFAGLFAVTASRKAQQNLGGGSAAWPSHPVPSPHLSPVKTNTVSSFLRIFLLAVFVQSEKIFTDFVKSVLFDLFCINFKQFNNIQQWHTEVVRGGTNKLIHANI